VAGRRKKAASEAPSDLAEAALTVLPSVPKGSYKAIGNGHSALNDATIGLVSQNLALCNSLPRVCAAVGIPRNTWRAWNKRGVADIQAGKLDSVNARWVQAINAARGQAVQSLIGVIYGAAQGGDWKAAAWLVERIAPEYRLAQKHEHALADKGKDMSSMPTDQLIALANKEPAPAETKRGQYDPKSATFDPDDYADVLGDDGSFDDGDGETAAAAGTPQEGNQGDC